MIIRFLQRTRTFIGILMLFVGVSAWGQTTITQWTFEESPLLVADATPGPTSGSGSTSIVGSMATPARQTGMNTLTGCGAQTSGTGAWAISNANPGASNESSGVRFNSSTFGFENIKFQWEQRWSGTATNTVRLQYTTDGTNWVNFTMTASNTTFCEGALDNGRFETNTTADRYRRITVDLSGVSAINNNPNFGVRVLAAHYRNTGQFRQVSTPTSAATGGTWRFDNVTFSGTCAAPTTQASDITFSGIASNSATINFTSGNGDGRIVVINTTNSFTNPTDGFNPTANTVYGSGEQVVFNGAGNSVTVTGLAPDTEHFVRVYEFRCDTRRFNTSTATNNPNSFTSLIASDPVITLSETNQAFSNTVVNSNSSAFTYNVQGDALTHDIEITAPTGFQVSKDNVNFSTSVTLNRVGNSVNEDVYVRFSPNTASGTFTGNVTHTSTGATQKDLSVEGIALAVEPTTSATSLLFSNITASTIRADFTPGNGSNRILVIREGAAVNFTPADATNYSANSDFSASTDLGSGNKIVFNGSGDNVTVTNLNPASTYHFAVFEYNIGTNNSQNYRITSPLTGSQSTFSPLDINASGFTYFQDFNTLALSGTGNSWTDNFTILGWYWQSPGDRDPNDVGYSAGTGSGTGAFATSFGPASNIDRAMGGISGGNPGPRDYIMGVQFQNTTGSSIDLSNLFVSYTGEQWRQTANARTLNFSYITSATPVTNITNTTSGWVNNTSLDFTTPQTGTAGELDGNASANSQVFDNIPLGSSGSLPNGHYVMLRWYLTGTISPGVAVDDFSLNYIVPTTYYYRGTGNLTDVANWTTEPSGVGGTSPANFTTIGQTFEIRNTSSVTLNANWTVSGAGSTVVLGNGTDVIEFTIPSAASLNATLSVNNNGQLIIENTSFPTFASVNEGSTITYKNLTNITLPLISYGNLTFDNASVNDPGGNNSLDFAGDFSLINGATFNCAGINLQATGTGDQTITGNNNTLTVRSFDRNGNAVKTSGRLILAANTPITVVNSVIMNNSGAANRFEDGGNTITVFNNATLDGDADGYLFTGTLRFVGDADNSNLRADGTNNVAAKGELNHLVIAKEGNRTMGIRGNVASEITTIKGNLVVESTSTGSLFLNEGEIRIGGDFIYSSSTQGLNVSSSTVVLNGTGSQTINFSVNRSLNNLTINKSSGTATISGAGELVVLNVLNLASGSLNTGDQLVLRSTATNTARVAPVGATASITGEVTAERFVTEQRKWRLMSSPVIPSEVANTVWDQWQNGGVPNGATGANLFGPGGNLVTNGLHQAGGVGIFEYPTNDGATGWVPVANTKTAVLSNGNISKGYLVFITNPFTTTATNITGTGASATTLTPKGTLQIGTVNVPTSGFGLHTLVGNPYASPISPEAVLETNEGDFRNRLWVFDTGIGSNGGYVVFDGTLGAYTNEEGTYSNSPITPIQSGQAFLVRPNSENPNFTFHESHKVTGNANLFRNQVSSSNIEQVRVSLSRWINNQWRPEDAVVAAFADGFSNDLDGDDITKMAKGGENLALRHSSTNLTVEYRDVATVQDTLTVRVTGVANGGQYRLRLFTRNYVNAIAVPYLYDTFTESLTEIPTNESVVEYTFETSSAAPTSAGDRFRIVFQDAPLSVDSPQITKMHVYPNPAQEGFVYVDMGNVANGLYSFNVVDMLGKTLLSETREHNGQRQRLDVSILPAGMYVVQISKGQEKYSVKLIVE